MKLKEMRELMARSQGVPPAALTPALRRAALAELGLDQSGLYQELEMSSPFVDAHTHTSESPDVIGLHSHAFWELLFVRQGRIGYLIGTRRFRVGAGDVLVLPPGTCHRPLFDEGLPEPYVRDVLWINDAALRELEARVGPLAPSDARALRTQGTAWTQVGELFSRAVEEARAEEGPWQAVCAARAIDVLVAVRRALADGARPQAPAAGHELVDDMIVYVENNLEGDLSLAATARAFYVSESAVGALFKRRVGLSFHRYVTQRRLIAAKALIHAGMPLGGVAAKTGFGDYSSFYRAFVREYGISPTRFAATLDPLAG